jgi:hypothetical protein
MWRPSRGRGVNRTLSPDAPTYAEDNFTYAHYLRSATQIDAWAMAERIAPAQIQPQAVGFFFSQKKIKTGPKAEVPAVPCALKPLGLVRLRWLSAELFPLPIEHSLN